MWIELAYQIEPRGFSTALVTCCFLRCFGAHDTVQHMDADMWLMGAWLSFDDQICHWSSSKFSVSNLEHLQTSLKVKVLKCLWILLHKFNLWNRFHKTSEFPTFLNVCEFYFTNNPGLLLEKGWFRARPVLKPVFDQSQHSICRAGSGICRPESGVFETTFCGNVLTNQRRVFSTSAYP